MAILRVLFCCLLVVAASGALAHGGHGQTSVQPAITVTFTDHDGNPQDGLSSRVFGPDGQRHLAGQTDALGRVVFLPDRAGEWVVKAMSEDGHGGTVNVQVGENLLLVGSADAHGHEHDHDQAAAQDHLHEHDNAASGGGMSFGAALGYLLGAFGVVALILSRKRPAA